MIGQRWTGAIVRSLLAGHSRFSDIRASIPDLSDRLLWERLKTLEEHGLVERTVVNRRHTEYVLTPMGRALEPVVRATTAWAEEWMAPPRARRARPRASRRTA
ncbi:MAG: helix-turn-helix transcriptional regulator [Actinomycetota bacterium]|nr:helix-turn-helix transcriptional regulator [Actinomycetota bacterium]